MFDSETKPPGSYLVTLWMNFFSSWSRHTSKVVPSSALTTCTLSTFTSDMEMCCCERKEECEEEVFHENIYSVWFEKKKDAFHLVVALFRLGALPLQDLSHCQLQTFYSWIWAERICLENRDADTKTHEWKGWGCHRHTPSCSGFLQALQRFIDVHMVSVWVHWLLPLTATCNRA